MQRIIKRMNLKAAEWLKQVDYDIATAEFLIAGERYFYAVFMGHLALEKALKGLYQEKLGKVPPKTHNLIYLLREIEAQPPQVIRDFCAKLSEANIATRYPEDLEKLSKIYTNEVARKIMLQIKETVQWIKTQF